MMKLGGIVGGFYSLNTLGNELGYYVATLEDVYNAPCNYSVTMLVNGVGF